MALDKIGVARLYQKRAKNYDLSANLYYLLGIREFAYRKKAVDRYFELKAYNSFYFGAVYLAAGESM
jgi:hypothetical protein